MMVKHAVLTLIVGLAIGATTQSQTKTAQSSTQPVVTATPHSVSAPDAQGVIYIDHEKVAAAPGQGGWLLAAENNRNFIVLNVRRDGPGEAEVHAQDTDIFYILEGNAKFVTGGSVSQPRKTSPVEIRGAGIQGGKAHSLQKGDVIVIPKGVPHWFEEVTPPFLYFVVKTR
jgi:mannose-6-phosphate isomerase-like protein (cupin superfamily)